METRPDQTLLIRPSFPVIGTKDLVYLVTIIDAELVTTPPLPSLTVTVTTTLRLAFGAGGVNLAVLPDPTMVPAVADHAKVNVSLSGSDAVTVSELVCAELIVLGTAVNLPVITGG